jgi:hypothetical protein
MKPKELQKNNYKNCLRQNQDNVKDSISNDLHEALLQKNNGSFWKTWNAKFGNKPKQSKIIEGLSDDNMIANAFAENFAANSSVNRTVNDEFAFKQRLLHYSGDTTNNFEVTVELVDSIISKLKHGKSAGFDNLTVEHLQFCHPIVVVTISKMFNLMLHLNYVPDAFGIGITIPIPKNKDKRIHDKLDDFRGITISPILSKVFESCILQKLQIYLRTSERQFGFKKSVGCRDAIYTVKSVINYFTKNNSTMNICAIDLTKAFDKVNHSVLFKKLMNLDVPANYINILKCWYSKINTAVKWGAEISGFVNLPAGVRQGGILSPFLFAIYVDDVLSRLAESGLRCFINCECFNSIMYADDLILMSISLMHLQLLVNICKTEFDKIDMQINTAKTGCLRIGARHAVVCECITIDGAPLKWLQEIKYLGIVLASANRLTINFQSMKQKFFRALNGIFGKVGLKTSPAVLCSLLNSFCTPILLYACESLDWNNKSIKSMENAYSQAFFKMFNTYDKYIIKQCQFYMGCLPICCLIDFRKLKFLYNLQAPDNANVSLSAMHHLAKWTDSDLDTLRLKYYIAGNAKPFSYKKSVFQYFKASLEI